MAKNEIFSSHLLRTDSQMVKRSLDILLSLLFLLTLFPIILLVVGTGIKCSSGGKVFFKQQRSGKNGKTFTCYKFCTMHPNSCANTQQACKGDERVTPIGLFLRKNSIDELPQFINVLLGNMSIVGPRPHMVKQTEMYTQSITNYPLRLSVKPGISGLAQVNGFRGEIKKNCDIEGRVKADIWYIKHWSPMLDVWIVFKTIDNMVHRRERDVY